MNLPYDRKSFKARNLSFSVQNNDVALKLSLSAVICDFWYPTFVIPTTAHLKLQGPGDAASAARNPHSQTGARSQHAWRAGIGRHRSAGAPLRRKRVFFLLRQNPVPVSLRRVPRAPNEPQTSASQGKADPEPALGPRPPVRPCGPRTSRAA